jgi:ABC-2 type transport system permease protein
LNTAILTLTLRQLLGKRRALLMLGLVALPVIVAVAFRIGEPDVDRQEWVANVLLKGFIITAILPLCTLVFGTMTLGEDIEDGTAVYLLSKPLPRSQVIAAKLGAAWLVAALLVSLSTEISGAIALQGTGGASILVGFTVATVLGSLVYCCVFVFLSVVTNRALIGGLIYVFLWEGVVTELFTGTRIFSVRQYTLGVADLIANTSHHTFEANLGGVAALVLMAIVAIAAIALAIRRLSRFEIRTSG